MAYKALYRTYRPSTFKEVAGQRHIVKTLQNALSTNKIAHAYLFCGPRGTGKTSMAKLFAKALNCEEGFGHQCNKCENCLSTNNNSHPDVIEIDAASNNGVDEVRDLIDKVKYSPIKGQYKIYIIDEVHMMTSGAFNALLKTLEEPPAHVIFILATTESHKVLPTIISRCQRYDFSKVDDEDIINRMIDILNIEKITFEPKALDIIVSLADGGVRDALSILDQVIAYNGTTITTADLEEIFGLITIDEKIKFLNYIIDGDIKNAYMKMNEFIAHGTDIKRLTTDLLEILKELVIYNNTNDMELLEIIDEKIAKSLLLKISSTQCLKMIEILLDTQSEFKTVNNIRSLFQITILKLTNLQEVTKTLYKEIESPQIELSVTRVKSKEIAPIITKEPEVKPAIDIKVPVIKKILATDGEKNKLDDQMIINIMSTGDRGLKLALLEKWDLFENYKFHPDLAVYANILGEGKPYVMNKTVLILEYQFAHKADLINIKANQLALREIVKAVCGIEISLYALIRNESVRLQKYFMELRQLSKLPYIDENKLIIDIKGE